MLTAVTQTFVVRLVSGSSDGEGERDSLHGVVEHVRSGCRETFADPNGLVAFLRAHGRQVQSGEDA